MDWEAKEARSAVSSRHSSALLPTGLAPVHPQLLEGHTVDLDDPDVKHVQLCVSGRLLFHLVFLESRPTAALLDQSLVS